MGPKVADATREVKISKSDKSLEKDTDHNNNQINSRLDHLLQNDNVLDQIHDAVIATDLNAVIIAWNKGAEQHFGYSASEIIGLPIYQLYPEERHDYLTSDVLDILKSKGNFEIESAMKRKSGQIFIAHSSLSALTDDNGEIIGIISYSLDISERKFMERELRFYKFVVDNTPDNVYWLDMNGNIIYANYATSKALGYSLEELKSMYIYDINPNLTKSHWDKEWAKLTEEDSFYFETQHQTRDGKIMDVEIFGNLITYEDTKYFTSIVRDITERKKEEQALRFHKITDDNAKDSIFWINADGRFEYINTAAYETRGYNREELLSMRVMDLHPGMTEADWRENWENRHANEGRLLETKHLTKGGRTIDVEIYSNIIEYGGKEFISSIVRDITERKRIEKDLRFNQIVVENASDGVYWVEQDGSFHYVNKSACDSLGYSRDELLAMHIYDIDPSITRTSWVERWKTRTREIKENAFLESQHITRDGRIIDVEIHANYINYGGKEYLCSIVRDVTERKKIDDSLKESEERYKLAMEGTTDGIWDWIINNNKNYSSPKNKVFYSSRYKTLLDFDEEEDLGSFVSQIHPDDYDYTIKALKSHLDKKIPFDVEYRLRTKSGSYRWFRSRGQALWDDHGNAIRMSGSIQDIDNRKKTEAELARYQNSLEELVRNRTYELERARESLLRSNLSLKALSQANHAMIHATDEKQLLDRICRIIVTVGDYKLAWVGYALNDEKKSIKPMAQYGYEKGYIEKLNLNWADNERGRGPAGIAIRTANSTLVKDIMTDPDFIPWREEALKHGYKSVAGFPLIENDNHVFGVLMIYSSKNDSFNEEEINLLEELTNNMTYGILTLRTKKELINKERLAALGRLIATVSHELRNPLGTIRTSLYTISQKLTGKNREMFEKQITRAERNVLRCDSIIEELLDYTRSTGFHPEEILLDELCNEVINDYVFPENIELSTNILPDIKARIEKEKIRRCLINVLNNACQSVTNTGNNEDIHSSLKLEISTGRNDEKIWIEIKDNGSGIPDNELVKIFEPLYSTKTYGVGLGLPIVKQIMEQHSGGISIDSKAGQGTSVLLWFPV